MKFFFCLSSIIGVLSVSTKAKPFSPPAGTAGDERQPPAQSQVPVRSPASRRRVGKGNRSRATDRVPLPPMGKAKGYGSPIVGKGRLPSSLSSSSNDSTTRSTTPRVTKGKKGTKHFIIPSASNGSNYAPAKSLSRKSKGKGKGGNQGSPSESTSGLYMPAPYSSPVYVPAPNSEVFIQSPMHADSGFLVMGATTNVPTEIMDQDEDGGNDDNDGVVDDGDTSPTNALPSTSQSESPSATPTSSRQPTIAAPNAAPNAGSSESQNAPPHGSPPSATSPSS